MFDKSAAGASPARGDRMSTCSRCGARFACAMADGLDAPCWCTRLPPAVPVPAVAGDAAQLPGCWCPACLEQHIAQQRKAAPGTQA